MSQVFGPPPVASASKQVLEQTWKCLSQPVHKNGLFEVLFPDRESLEATASIVAPLTFCRGLSEVLTAPAPPTIEYFKRLPGLTTKEWGVYGLVMEHPKEPGTPARLYVGCGTEAERGVVTRFSLYNKKITAEYLASDRFKNDPWPKWVRAALKAGLRITHKGLFVSCRLPTAAKVPVARTLFKALETAFSFTFWAMKSEDSQDYGMAACCPWSRKDFQYRGLCSHSALLEGIIRNFDLTDEEREQVAWHARERRRLRILRWRHEHPELERATQLRWLHKKLFKGEYLCECCSVPCKSQWELDRHNSSRHHEQNVKAMAAGKKRWHCDPCGKWFHSQCNLARHEEGLNHDKWFDRLVAAGLLERPLEGTEPGHRNYQAEVPKVLAEDAPPPSDDPKAPWSCEICKTPLMSAARWAYHFNSTTHLMLAERATGASLPSKRRHVALTADELPDDPLEEAPASPPQRAAPPRRRRSAVPISSDPASAPAEGPSLMQAFMAAHPEQAEAHQAYLAAREDRQSTVAAGLPDPLAPTELFEPSPPSKRFRRPQPALSLPSSDDELPDDPSAASTRSFPPRAASTLSLPTVKGLPGPAAAPATPQPAPASSTAARPAISQGPGYCVDCKHDYKTKRALASHCTTKTHRVQAKKGQMTRSYLEDFNSRHPVGPHTPALAALGALPVPSTARAAGPALKGLPDQVSRTALLAPATQDSPAPSRTPFTYTLIRFTAGYGVPPTTIFICNLEFDRSASPPYTFIHALDNLLHSKTN